MTESVQVATPGWLAGDDGHRLLTSYLNQQLVDSAAALRLARRMAGLYHDSAFGVVLTGISTELAQDRASVRALMERLGISVSRYRAALGLFVDTAGRLTPTGQLLARSPLRPALELETLRLAVERKWTVWTTLRALAEQDRRLDAGRLDALVHRARRQADTLDELRLEVARAALSSRTRAGVGAADDTEPDTDPDAAPA
ncbi:hypothetical protein I6A84_07045 [Frankia sp. CNm7]|uniref:Uncharacterized protein n=1 Tax=Frankia nepalensis TaxID=1836974 RepID=A0A937RKI4_9ACTN|nr:hypothetical protein [Frankia nepalensis]MBL7499431.1 hypothetical protein [Frankia nepalensis]MBL7514914.1 hypothetical protein [Frankia nepalensis]MBL7517885.1 hypothetical protein [Frankia nepalensis]MBL7631837.1 hypothetical protein [Frankia nepalensis]